MARILIIEDDDSIRTSYVHCFQIHGYEVTEAQDAARAIWLLDQVGPDVILLDMLMPGLSGLEFLKQTKVAQRFPHMVIIGFSNIDTPRVIKEAHEHGITKYVLKVDVTPPEMVKMVDQFLSDRINPNQNKA